MEQSSLQNAIEKLGGRKAFAEALGITPQALDGWRLRGQVPAERVPEIERLTGVSRSSLRPDLWPQVAQ